VKHRLPAKSATERTASARIEANMVNTEEASSVEVHIDEMIGERGLFVEVHERTIASVMDLAVFLIRETTNIA
jgi:hypothetical protein